MIHTSTVAFTKSGWKQYLQMNRRLGIRFIKGFILRLELAAYLAAYEDSGVVLDSCCQELRYDDGIYLLLMKNNGVWYITNIWAAAMPAGYEPVYTWQRVKRGWQTFASKVLAGWRHIFTANSQGVTLA